MEYRKNISITEGGRKFSFGPVKRVQTKRQGSDEMAVWVPKDNFKLDDLTAYEDGEYTPEDYAFGTVNVRVSSAGIHTIHVPTPDGDYIFDIDDRLIDPIDPTQPGEPTVIGITDPDGNPIYDIDNPDGPWIGDIDDPDLPWVQDLIDNMVNGVDELGNPWNVDINGLGEMNAVSGFPEGIGGALVGELDGANVMVSVNTNGDLVVDYPPDEIRVTVPPTKIIYYDGDDIDYTGMVVTGYRNGVQWSDAKHPNGIIPISELKLKETKVELGNNPHYKSDEETVFIDGSEILVPKDVKLFTPEPISYIDTPNYRQYSFDEATEQSYAVIFSPDNSNDDSAYVVNGDINYDGSNIHLRVATIWQTGQTSSGKLFRCYDLKASDKIYRSVSPLVQRDVRIQTTESNRIDYLDGNGPDRYTPNEYTYDGRTVYWTTGWSFTFYDPPKYDLLYNYLVEPTEIAKPTITSRYFEKMAWFMLYGDMQPFDQQSLEIGYKNLKTSTQITVLGEIET